MTPLKLIGWIALLLLVAGFTVWRIANCNCYPPANGSQWASLLIKAGTGVLVSGMIIWEIVKGIKAGRASE